MNTICECYASSKHDRNRTVFIRDLNSLTVALSCISKGSELTNFGAAVAKD